MLSPIQPSVYLQVRHTRIQILALSLTSRVTLDKPLSCLGLICVVCDEP